MKRIALAVVIAALVVFSLATAAPQPAPAAALAPPAEPTRNCWLRWGSTTLADYGDLTQQECADKGN